MFEVVVSENKLEDAFGGVSVLTVDVSAEAGTASGPVSALRFRNYFSEAITVDVQSDGEWLPLVPRHTLMTDPHDVTQAENVHTIPVRLPTSVSASTFTLRLCCFQPSPMFDACSVSSLVALSDADLRELDKPAEPTSVPVRTPTARATRGGPSPAKLAFSEQASVTMARLRAFQSFGAPGVVTAGVEFADRRGLHPELADLKLASSVPASSSASSGK